MIAASLKDAEGDQIIDLLLRKGADVSMKSNSGQVSDDLRASHDIWLMIHRMPCISQVPNPTILQSEVYWRINVVLG